LLAFDYTPKGIENIRDLPCLEELHTGNALQDESMPCIASLPNLRRLTIWSRGVTAKGLAGLCNHPTLAELAISQVERESVDFSGVKALGVLNAPRTQFCDADLATMAKLTKGEELHLRNTRVTEEGLRHLAGMTNLRLLSLNTPTITGKGLLILKEL